MGVLSCGTTMLDQGVFENIGSVTWDTTAKTSGFTAVSGNGYFCNTTSSAFTVTLPSSPSAGDIVGIKDYANTADTNTITIGRNGSNIQGVADDFKLEIEGGSVFLVYVDGTQGWKVTSSAQNSDIGTLFIEATGGTITTSGDYKIHTFTSPGTFCVSNAGAPAGSNTVDYLVVAGGGGGGSGEGGGGRTGGGGGAGGWRASSGAASGCYSAGPAPLVGSVSALPVSVTSYPITVGAGGAGSGPPTSNNPGCNGSNSIFSTITSSGGGGGDASGGACGVGQNGGSGGGATRSGTAGTGNSPPVSPPQGNNGGPSGGTVQGGGGGGATAAGSSGPNGSGGAGAPSSIPGSASTKSAGGSGGGGSSGSSNSGNGGQGGPTCGTGGNGGSGIIVIRYKYQ
jgi:hypothetical protein